MFHYVFSDLLLSGSFKDETITSSPKLCNKKSPMTTRFTFTRVQQLFPKKRRNKQIPKGEVSPVSVYLSWEITGFTLLRLLENTILNKRDMTSFC